MKTWDGKNFDELKSEAKIDGLVVPINDVFSQEAWVHYWQQCELARQGLIEGRPVVPHRTGRSKELTEG